MSERKKIEDRLNKKEHEIVTLEEKIKVAKVYVQALRDILKMLGSENPNQAESDAEATLRSGSAVDLARRAILEKGIPVHIDEILAALGKDATREAKASLTSSIAAYVRRKEIFTRPAPNTFGLVELGHTSNEDTSGNEPPRDFGKRVPKEVDLDDEIPF